MTMPTTTSTGQSISPLSEVLPHHYAELQESGLTDATIRTAGVCSEESFVKLAVLLQRKWPRTYGPALLFPYHDESGAVVLWRAKPDHPPVRNGKPLKYIHPTGAAVRAYFPTPLNGEVLDSGRLLVITEGEKKTLAGNQAGVVTIGLMGVDCWHRPRSSALIPDLERVTWKRRKVFVCFDSDAETNENVRTNEALLADTLGKHGAVVRILRLPPGPNGEKVGLDDFLVVHGSEAFFRLLETATEPERPRPEETRIPAAKLDPATEAQAILAKTTLDGLFRLRYWRGSFYFWTRGAYRERDREQVRGEVVRYVNHHVEHLTTSVVNNILDQLRAQASLENDIDAPAWLGEPPTAWPTSEILVARNGLFHLPSIAEKRTPYCLPATPRLFSTAALDYDVALDAAKPERWLQFVSELWPEDPEAIDTLQEILGYLLTADTSQQKVFFLVSPKRGGKGTIARATRGLIGAANVTGPSMTSLALPFGLWGLLDKSVAIIPDARLSTRSDKAMVTERILAVSGEDLLLVDRKLLPPVHAKLPTRLIILSNEIPRFADSSGTIASRMIVLRMTKTWYGHEDVELTKKLLAELPGILVWAIGGWARLQQRGHFIQPQSGADVVDEMEDLASPVGAFVKDCCLVGPTCEVPRKDLYTAFGEWAKDNGKTFAMDEATFGRDLRAVLPAIGDVQRRIDGDRERFYRGLGLKTGF